MTGFHQISAVPWHADRSGILASRRVGSRRDDWAVWTAEDL